MSAADLLFELGTEELPAGEISAMATALCQGVTDGLTEANLAFTGAHHFSTPRRLTVWVENVAIKGPDSEQQVVGPPVSAAKDDSGAWTKAAEGFARKQGISADDLIVVEEQGVERVAAHVSQKGAQATEVIPDIIANAVAGIPVSKRMRWGRSRDEFLRPVQWLVLLLGDAVLPLQLFGLKSGRESRGHRFHHNTPVAISSPAAYRDTLREARVLVDMDERRALIAEQVLALANKGEAVALSEDLLDEVTGLVEWPSALRGSFDQEFLAVPAQALISAMKTHQKYFHLNDASSGSLLPAFITVANIESKQPEQVVSGNERVIRPRLSDAAFFFANDKQTSLISRQDRLGSVVFQHHLGSLLDKTRRVVAIAKQVANAIGADETTTLRAAELSKCDLVSEMVLEFPDLQGIAGAEYARHDEELGAVAEAIEYHYYPRFAGDELPPTPEATAVALADRLDTLIGIFGIGEPPTGSKDPFALRRASLAVIRMLIDLKKPLSLTELLQGAFEQHTAELAPDTADAVSHYITERLGNWYDDDGIHISVVRAALAAGATDLFDIDLRVRALNAFAKTETAEHLAAANKRVANILAKADEVDGTPADSNLFVHEAEHALHEAVSRVGWTLRPLLADRNYQSALDELAQLRGPVDAFFDGVMVNAEDPAERSNRLRLLGGLRALFTQVADLALLSSAAE
ncbi:MAG: glycine--tRNA ligase subunit beta [Halieaceae bacterium]|nr:MAG: glycine--tRNA ligase subunit beta [Halieaceae bacterium]|tara:strand:- start:408 stop:2483 length:2076 start_codon:yes stop_codon:yes gene_type:complete